MSQISDTLLQHGSSFKVKNLLLGEHIRLKADPILEWLVHSASEEEVTKAVSFSTRKSVHRTRMPPPNAIQKKGLYVTVTGIP